LNFNSEASDAMVQASFSEHCSQLAEVKRRYDPLNFFSQDMNFRKRGGRKLVVTPDGAEWAPRPRLDNAMVKALARAFRWRRMLDEGEYATLVDLARAKGVAPSVLAISSPLSLTPGSRGVVSRPSSLSPARTICASGGPARIALANDDRKGGKRTR
jgi:hypothetical protein